MQTYMESMESFKYTNKKAQPLTSPPASPSMHPDSLLTTALYKLFTYLLTTSIDK